LITIYQINTYLQYKKVIHMSGIIGGIKGSMKKKFVAVTTSSSDPYWSSVSLLLTGDDLADHSSNPKTVTPYGNTVVSTSTKKYGAGSMYFDGSGDYLDIPNSAAFALNGGDFTFETWLNTTNGALCPILACWHNGGGWTFYLRNNKMYFYDPSLAGEQASTTVLSNNTWYHLAWVLSGSTLRYFINGTLTDTFSGVTVSATSNNPQVGQGNTGSEFFSGYLDDLRLTKGVARYTSNFTPPTAALPVPSTATASGDYYWTNVPLYINGEDLLDHSSSPKSIANNGSTAVNTTTKKFGSSSLFFNGSTQYLTVTSPATSIIDWYSSDYTVEFWVNPSAFGSSSNGNANIVGNVDPGSSIDYWSFGTLSNGTVKFYYYNGSQNSVTTTATVSSGVWTHLAMTHNNGTIRIFINGVLSASGTKVSTPQSSNSYPLSIGKVGGSSFNGYIDDLRITSGTARYTANFTPPVATFPTTIGPMVDLYWSDVSLLMTGDDLYDHSATAKSITVTGNTTVNKAVKKYGTGSLYFDASSDYVTFTDSTGFGSNDFTIELWFYPTTSWAGAFSLGATANTDYAGITFANSGTIYISTTGSSWQYTAINCGTVSNNTWTHLAFTRSGNNFYVWNNGTLASTTAISGSIANKTGQNYIGTKSDAMASSLNGYIEDFRITKNVARYNANFTPPTVALPKAAPTIGTQVYKSVTRTGTGTVPWVASGAGFAPDFVIMSGRNRAASLSSSYQNSFIDSVRKATEHIQPVNTQGEGGGWGTGHIVNADGYNGTYGGDGGYYNVSGGTYVDHFFKRAPGFMDVVGYTGTGSAVAHPHTLGVPPEFIIWKATNEGTVPWYAYHTGNGSAKLVEFSSASTPTGSATTAATATTFSYSDGYLDVSGRNYIVYMFATLPGISKVGSYTGNGGSLLVNCGFSSSARFVILRRVDSTGNWYVFDSARGIVAGANDPVLTLNGYENETTTVDTIDPDNSGFIIKQNTTTNLNVSSGSYIYFAIA
jgi:hypothetical protein